MNSTKKICCFLLLLISGSLVAQWRNTENNHTTKQLSIGGASAWAPITINSTVETTVNAGVSLAFEGGGFPEIGYRLRANGSNYFQVLYNGSSMNWKHYEGGRFISKMSLTNSGSLGLGTTAPDMKLSVFSPDSYISRFHHSGNAVISGIRLGRGLSYGDFVTTTLGFGIGAGTDISNLPLNSQNVDDIDLFIHKTTGNVGIGTIETGPHKLAVEGSIGAREIKVEINKWSDFVFEKGYYLPSLTEVEKHIAEKGHLKDIPSAKEVMEYGVLLGDMNARLLRKIEELTLYVIQQEKRITSLEGFK